MALDKARVKKIARLARVRVPDGELDELAGELSQIFDWIEQLGEVDTTDVPPMTSVVDVAATLRPDEATDTNNVEDVLANAPDPSGAYFTVPKVVE
jgi:aspartyl-tRNA(Asn)/glutamyl-tRNA(Gln) amidotransferase subunit C